ncbi:MAG: Photosystem I assembly protein Ycf3 [Candidatus Omnitrophica bacterium]|nr:Photosystem I assembly protein Ycf3 [Candidatus Omnitrophota bacterium]
MHPETRKFILENAGRLTVREIAERTGLREKNVRSVLRQAPKDPTPEPSVTSIAPPGTEPSRAVGPVLPWAAALSAAAIAVLVYANALDGSFHFDDTYTIVQNPVIKEAGDLKRLFDQFNARFLTGLTLALNYRLGGLETTGYHAVNVALHAIASALVALLASALMRTPAARPLADRSSGRLLWVAPLAAGALFAAHPLQTQAVNYIWQRAAVMATVCYVGAVWTYVEARLRQDRRWTIAAWTLTVAAMFCKEISLTLPAALVLTELWWFGRPGAFWKERSRALAPFLACLVIIPILLLNRSQSEGIFFVAPAKVEAEAPASGLARLEDFTRWESERNMPRAHYYLTQLNVLRSYLRMIVWPAGQSVVHDYPITTSADLGTALSLALLAAMAAAAWVLRRRAPAVGYGVAWFFLTLSMESLVPLPDVMFEHRLYLPMAGVAVAVALGPAYGRLPLRPLAASALAALTALAVTTHTRNRVWKDEVSLWTDAMKKYPEDPRPYSQLGNHYAEARLPGEAIPYLVKAVELDPRHAKDYANLGGAYFESGRVDEALGQFETAIRLGESAGDRLSVSAAYSNAGNVYSQRGDKQRARQYYLKAVEADPMLFHAYNNLCIVSLDLGDPKAAVEYGRKAVETNPDFPDSHYNLGIAYLRAGRPADARGRLEALTALGRADLAERLDGVIRRS